MFEDDIATPFAKKEFIMKNKRKAGKHHNNIMAGKCKNENGKFETKFEDLPFE